MEQTRRPKKNPLKAEGIEKVDYKDTKTLRLFISDRGKIRSRRVTGLTPQQQRQVATAVKNAREMALLPFTTRYLVAGFQQRTFAVGIKCER